MEGILIQTTICSIFATEMNQYWGIIIKCEPQFILAFTLYIIQYNDAQKHIMLCFHHYSIMWNVVS